MGIDIEVIRERIRIEREQQRETLAWYTHRTVWAPVLSESERQEREKQIAAGIIPF